MSCDAPRRLTWLQVLDFITKLKGDNLFWPFKEPVDEVKHGAPGCKRKGRYSVFAWV